MGTVTQVRFSASSLFEVLVLCPTQGQYAGSQELVSGQRQRIQPDEPWKTSVSKVRKYIDAGKGALDTSVVMVLKSLAAGEVNRG